MRASPSRLAAAAGAGRSPWCGRYSTAFGDSASTGSSGIVFAVFKGTPRPRQAPHDAHTTRIRSRDSAAASCSATVMRLFNAPTRADRRGRQRHHIRGPDRPRRSRFHGSRGRFHSGQGRAPARSRLPPAQGDRTSAPEHAGDPRQCELVQGVVGHAPHPAPASTGTARRLQPQQAAAGCTRTAPGDWICCRDHWRIRAFGHALRRYSIRVLRVAARRILASGIVACRCGPSPPTGP